MNTNHDHLVSIIIPTYNRAYIISDAIESALNQTFKDFEIIVIDDGSSDDTIKVIERFGDKIKYFYKENSGESGARNFSINKAKGKYISFLDSDDLWLPERLEKAITQLEQNNEYSAAITEIEFINKSGETLGFSNYSKTWPKQTNNDILAYVLKNPLAYFSNLIVRKEVLLEVGEFDENLKTGEDIDYFLRIATNHKITLIAKPLLKYRKMPDSLSHNLFTGNRLKIIDKFKKNNPDLAKKYNRIININISNIHLSYAEDLLWNRYIKESRKEIFESLKNNVTFKAIILYLKSLAIQLASVIFPQYKDKGTFTGGNK